MLAVAADESHMSEADETDGGRPGGARLRTCIATRTAKPVDELMRFVVGPDGAVTPDLKAALPGRGVWVTATAAAVDEAMRRKAFARGFRRDAAAPPDLAARVERLLAERAREALSIANKAGEVVAGFGKVEAEIGAGRAFALVHAAEAAADGAAKLDRKFLALGGNEGAILRELTGDELDLALGRSNVVHAALGRGAAARACLTRFRNLIRYRTGGLAVPDGAGGAAKASTRGTDSE
jgi:predicted RNA-binding protein YlxR (DUF448 family)